jgi:hypothetical protein
LSRFPLEDEPGAAPTSLPAIEALLWAELAAAPQDKSHPWRMMTLATLGLDAQADARLVVIREVDASARSLCFFTDARSPKVAQMQHCDKGTLVCWNAARGWQLRLKVSLSVADSGLAVSSRWARLKMTPAAHDYLSPLPPGALLNQPTVERGSREFFAMVTATVDQIDWLELNRAGQRRALFGGGRPARWVQP